MMVKKSSTQNRQSKFYPTPQNQAKLIKATTDIDGQRKDGTSKNKIINEALSKYFASILL